MPAALKIGAFVDAEYIRCNGAYQMRYDVLRRFVARGNRSPSRLNTYVAFDAERANEDAEYASKAYAYQQAARQFGWKVISREVRLSTDATGGMTTRTNAGVPIAVDALLQAEFLDEVLLVAGDEDLLPLVGASQDRGCRVDLLGFDNCSPALQRQVDFFHSGFLIPELVPVGYEPRNQWGSTGSCVRGLCSKWFPDKGYGFLSFLRAVSENAWIHDARLPGSPWASVFCHINEVAGEVTEADLINGDTCLEFYIHESPQEEGGLVAQNVRLVQQ
jgi:uncharacterized LabA/DUF88 family protein